MKPRSFAALDAAVLALALAGGFALPTRAEGARRETGVQVRTGGARTTKGVTGGRPLSPADLRAASVLAPLLGARALLPEALRVPVVVQLDPVALTFAPAPGALEAFPAGGAIAVRSDAPALLDRGVWLHELVHVAAAGPRPTASVAARLMTAVDEGVADFAAAAFGGSSVVGVAASGESRDLAAPPFVGESEWAYVALPSAPWDTHRLGHALAATLYREPERRALAEDAVHGLANPAPFAPVETPGAVLAAWIDRCPVRSREALVRAVRRWAPPELFPGEGPS
jgi:hypothetical protein